MPLYDVWCPECEIEVEVFLKLSQYNDARCPKCGGPARVLVTMRNKDWFFPHVNENFNGQPIEVTSRKHLRELCRKFNVTAKCLG